MPQLNILQHKSYHVYNEKNKQRVREDEARAAAEELAREQARLEGASAARLDELRRRAGSPSFQSRPGGGGGADEDEEAEDNLPSTSFTREGEGGGDSLIERHKRDKARAEKRERKIKERLDFDWPSETARKEARRAERRGAGESEAGGRGRSASPPARGEIGDKWETGGHINLFADIEREARPVPTPAEIAKKKKEQEADKFTVYLGRPEKETKPWYSDRDLRRYEEREAGDEAEERRQRDKRKDLRAKTRHDPLTSISSLLPKPRPQPRPSSNQATSTATPADARASREQSERQRALALIAKTKADRAREAARAARGPWDDTPSTVAGGRSWAEEFEREKDRAGHRFNVGGGGGGGGGGRERGRDAGWGGGGGRDGDRGGYGGNGRVGGRSWEV